MPQNEAKITGPDMCAVDYPNLEGVEVEVQHALGQGGPAEGLGMFGFGVITMPNGQPRVLAQIRHHDGSSLGSILKAGDVQTLREVLADCEATAQAISLAADQATKQ
jgi:hypothetical protein